MYTDEIRNAVKSLTSPKGFVVDIVEYTDFDPQFIGLRFYSSQWDLYSEDERLSAALYLKEMKEVIESYNVLVTLEPVNGAPSEEL